MKTSVTISLLPSNARMPFVLGPDLESSVKTAAELGYHAFELFPPAIETVDVDQLGRLTREFDIAISTIGTGGGAVSQGLTLTDQDAEIRNRGFEYVRQIIETAGDLGASAIIGSMQGSAGDRDPGQVLTMLGEALAELGEYALKWDQRLFYEPLNRYETDLVHTLDDASDLLAQFGANNSKILADLFHMNIEEVCLPTAIIENADRLGHVHFVDSNRRAMGLGHLDVKPIVEALQQTGYSGYLAVEAFPLPRSKCGSVAGYSTIQEARHCLTAEAASAAFCWELQMDFHGRVESESCNLPTSIFLPIDIQFQVGRWRSKNVERRFEALLIHRPSSTSRSTVSLSTNTKYCVAYIQPQYQISRP